MEEREKMKKIMPFIVATNVVASRPPERRPTGTPHARANLKTSTKTLRLKVEFETEDPSLVGFDDGGGGRD